jgi:GH24 family phage-related lysozyme (muramidase)
MNEMPGLTALVGLHREVKGRAEKLGDASAIDASVKEQRTNNIISIEMVRQLRSINNNVLQQTRISALQANNAKQIAMFAEENDREKAQRDKELLDAIKSLKDGKGAGGALGAGGAGAGGKGLLGTLFDVLQNASLLEAIGTLAGGKYVIDKGKAIFGKGAGGVPTTGGGVPTTGGGVPTTGGGVPTTGGAGGGGKPPTGGGGKVIPFPPGGRGGIPPIAGGGGGFGGAGGLLRGAGFAARGILRVLLGPIGWALLAAEVGYEAYKIFGASGGQRSLKKEQDNLGGDYDAMGNYTGGGAGLGGGVSQTAQKVVRGTYAVGDPRRRSTVGAVGEDAAKFITGKEGFVGKATKDTNKMAIGYGHNITDAEIKSGQIDLGNGEFIKISGEGGKDTTVTKEQAGKLFSKDLGVYESIVVRAIGQEAYNKLSQNQKTAILSYVYNTGKVPAGFAEAIKAGNYANAAKSIRDGIATASGEKDPERRKQLEAGLKKRRKEEGDLFDTAGPATSEQRSGGVVAKTSANFTPVSRATPVSNVATDDSMYVDDGNGLMVLKSELSKTKSERGLQLLGGPLAQSRSGSKTKDFVGPIQVEDKKANAILGQQLKSTKVVARQTGVVAKSTTARETRKQTTLLERANQTFLNQFQNTTQRLLSKAIYDTLVVGAYGKQGSRNLVTKQQTMGETFRGQQVAKMLGLNKGTEKVLTSVFGKQIGKAYAPMVSQLGTAYLEVGATKVGRDLFSSILGNDKNADALTGQILGNFARGNKQAATEQLLYGLTGVASGPETIFAKYGFNSSQQGANFLGGYGAAQLTAPLAGMMGGNQPTYRGPNGQGTYGAGQTPMMQPATQQGAYYSGFNAKGNQQNFVNPEMMKLAIEGDKAAQKELPHIADGTWENLAQAKADLKLKTEQYLEAKVDTAEFETARAAQAQAQARLTERTNEILASKPSAVGGGSSAGGTFMSSMGNFAFDLGTSLVASKLTQGIKNPYAKAFANFAVASAANSFIKPMIFGAPTIAGAAASATPSLFTASNASSLGSSFLPSSGTGVAGTAGNILAASGYTQAGSFMSGVQSGMNIFSSRGGELGYRAAGETGASAMGELVGEYLPYAASIVKLLQGDVKGAVLTAAGTYIGAEIGFAVAGPAGAIVGSILGSIFGGSVGQRTPKPAVLRVTSSSGNEISAVTAWAKDSPPEAWSKFADTILVGLLNSAKLMQQQSGVTLPFVNIGIYVDSQSGISLCLYQEGEATNTSALPKWSKNFGSIKDFKMGTAIVGMIEYMRDCLKEGKDSITTDKLDKAAAELKTKNIQTITTGVLSELKAGGQYDLTKGVGYNSGTPTSDGRSVGTAKARITGVTTTTATITPAAKNTSAASLTSSSAETKTTNNSAPINSVVAVGGKTENDNSMNITNINQMSLTNDPWRQPFINTSYQLAA